MDTRSEPPTKGEALSSDEAPTAPDVAPASVPPLTDLRPAPPPARLHRPRRAIVAAVELVFAVALAAAAVWAWRRSVIPYEIPSSENPAVPRFVSRRSGPWLGSAFGLVALAGLLVLDALRQVVLALRAHALRKPRAAFPAVPEDEPDA